MKKCVACFIKQLGKRDFLSLFMPCKTDKMKWLIAALIGATAGAGIHKVTKYTQEKARKTGNHVPYGPYEALFKRPIDAVLGVVALIVLSPVLLIIGILVKVKLGSPVIFKQERPGKDEKIFTMYKFRTMTDKKDENGNLLPDEERLTNFGKHLRASSGDELSELVNIIKGDMAIVGPRPQLIRDMVFMNVIQRRRHSVRPGLTGLAQVMGRNSITWDEKLLWDIKYVDNISFVNDVKILWLTLKKVLGKNESIDELEITDDYGDWLLSEGMVTQQEYVELQKEAKQLSERFNNLN